MAAAHRATELFCKYDRDQLNILLFDAEKKMQFSYTVERRYAYEKNGVNSAFSTAVRNDK